MSLILFAVSLAATIYIRWTVHAKAIAAGMPATTYNYLFFEGIPDRNLWMAAQIVCVIGLFGSIIAFMLAVRNAPRGKRSGNSPQ